MMPAAMSFHKSARGGIIRVEYEGKCYRFKSDPLLSLEDNHKLSVAKLCLQLGITHQFITGKRGAHYAHVFRTDR